MNKNQIIQQELQKIGQIRVANEMARENAKLSARQIPKYRALDDEIRKLTLELGKLPTSSPEVSKIAKKIEQLNTQAIKVLKLNNFPIDELKFLPNCTHCNDTGYIVNKMCDCLIKKVRDALITQSSINNVLQFDFSHCDNKILEANPQLSKIYKFAHKYCDEFSNLEQKNLLLFGEVGTGKTFLLECIANELLRKLHYVVFITAYEVCSTMVKAYSASYNDRDTILSPLFESELLIIDDLGTEPLFHDSTLTNLFTLINERQKNNLATIVSTNLDPEQIGERYGDRLRSRLYNARTTTCIKFEGKDLRAK